MKLSFFWFETQYPSGSGFQIGGFCHLIWIFLIIWFVGKSTDWYCNRQPDQREYAKKWMGTILPVMEIYRDAVLVITGYWNVGFLPFHLCSIALILACVYAYTRLRAIGVFYALVCIPGAAAAVFFPNWTAYPLFSYMHLHAFLAHGLTIAYGFWILGAKEIEIRKEDYAVVIGMGAAAMLLFGRVNRMLDTNFWFLETPSNGFPLEKLWQSLPDGMYQICYVMFCMGMVGIWQVCVRLWQGRKMEEKRKSG